MEFCPKCGAMMFPSGGVLKCNTCGYSDELENNNSIKLIGNINASDMVENENIKNDKH